MLLLFYPQKSHQRPPLKPCCQWSIAKVSKYSETNKKSVEKMFKCANVQIHVFYSKGWKGYHLSLFSTFWHRYRFPDVRKMIHYALAYIFTCLLGLINHIGEVLPFTIAKGFLKLTSTPAFNAIHFKGILLKCLICSYICCLPLITPCRVVCANFAQCDLTL